jgi:hypothetical protein
MPDRTTRIAQFLLDEGLDMSTDATIGTVINRWPDATPDEIDIAIQAVKIALRSGAAAPELAPAEYQRAREPACHPLRVR